MARLSTEQIKEELGKKGYELVSDEGYVNMNSFITMKCPHGHIFKATLADFRHPSFECPLCIPNIEFKNPVEPPEKKEGSFRVIGFDQATEKFGMSIWDDGKLVYYDLFIFKGLVINRIAQIRKFIKNFVIDKWKPDIIVMEDIQYQARQNGGLMTFKVLAQLLGVIEELCFESGIKYEVVSPNVWRKYAGTAGKNRKEEKMLSVAKVKERFSINVTDDVAESILIGSYGCKMFYKAF